MSIHFKYLSLSAISNNPQNSVDFITVASRLYVVIWNFEDCVSNFNTHLNRRKLRIWSHLL